MSHSVCVCACQSTIVNTEYERRRKQQVGGQLDIEMAAEGKVMGRRGENNRRWKGKDSISARQAATSKALVNTHITNITNSGHS